MTLLGFFRTVGRGDGGILLPRLNFRAHQSLSATKRLVYDAFLLGSDFEV